MEFLFVCIFNVRFFAVLFSISIKLALLNITRMKNMYFELAQILILIGSHSVIVNGLDFVGDVLLSSSPNENQSQRVLSDPKNACKNCKTGMETSTFE